MKQKSGCVWLSIVSLKSVEWFDGWRIFRLIHAWESLPIRWLQYIIHKQYSELLDNSISIDVRNIQIRTNEITPAQNKRTK